MEAKFVGISQTLTLIIGLILSSRLSIHKN